MLGSADLDALLADSGDTVTYSGTTVNCWLDEPDAVEQDASGMIVPISRRSVLVKTGAIAPPTDATVTINGVTHTVRDSRLEPPDGAYTRILVDA
jgi:hypothetical protein